MHKAGIEEHKGVGKLQHAKRVIAKSHTKKTRKTISHGNSIGSIKSKNNLVKLISKGRRKNSGKRGGIGKAILHTSSSLSKQNLISDPGEKQLPLVSCNEKQKNAKGEDTSDKFKQRRRRKRQKNNLKLDEASRLQRRTRYLLIKMKVEQNLLDAYSAEGWRGQSREKIKPERELQRAKKQILRCKLGIRDAIRQLDLLGSVGCMEDSAIAPDGSVHHEHIHCAKCKLREAFPDNDIILCDGTCNCAFHQKCLDPPLLTENIPPGDQGWFCKFCECKMDILEAMNAHLGTNFSVDSNWQGIFKEEAALPDGGNTLLHPENEWPSDDSEDDDYDPEGPEQLEISYSYSRASSEVDASDDASSSWSLENEVLSESGMGLKSSSAQFVVADSDETSDCEIISGRRQRRAVDYRKLYDEMFGKDAPANEQISEDEDWGPTKRKRREKESDAASTLMSLCETEEKSLDENTTKEKATLSCQENKRSLFRIPANAVEKLRLVFAENELPSRSVKENLSKQLGLDSEKVNKWFKNARYLALKTRKAGQEKPLQNASPLISKDSGSENGEQKTADQMQPKDVSDNVVNKPRNSKRFRRRKNQLSLTKQRHERDLLLSPSNNKADMDIEDDVSLKVLREEAKNCRKRVAFNGRRGEQEAEAEMERLCRLKCKLEKLKQVLLTLPNHKSSPDDAPTAEFNDHSIVYVPVAELREKT